MFSFIKDKPGLDALALSKFAYSIEKRKTTSLIGNPLMLHAKAE